MGTGKKKKPEVKTLGDYCLKNFFHPEKLKKKKKKIQVKTRGRLSLQQTFIL